MQETAIEPRDGAAIAAVWRRALGSAAGLYRDGVDLDLHWFTTPHLEVFLTTRLELLDHGSGPTGGYALGQLHYRLSARRANAITSLPR